MPRREVLDDDDDDDVVSMSDAPVQPWSSPERATVVFECAYMRHLQLENAEILPADDYALDPEFAFETPPVREPVSEFERTCQQLKRLAKPGDALARAIKKFEDVEYRHTLVSAALEIAPGSTYVRLSHFDITNVPDSVWKWDIKHEACRLIFEVIDNGWEDDRRLHNVLWHALPHDVLVNPSVAAAIFLSPSCNPPDHGYALLAIGGDYVVPSKLGVLDKSNDEIAKKLAPWLTKPKFLAHVVEESIDRQIRAWDSALFRACWQLAFGMSLKWYGPDRDSPELGKVHDLTGYYSGELSAVPMFRSGFYCAAPSEPATAFASEEFAHEFCCLFRAACGPGRVRTPLLLYQTARDCCPGGSTLPYKLLLHWLDVAGTCPVDLNAMFAHLQYETYFVDLVKVCISEHPIMFLPLINMINDRKMEQDTTTIVRDIVEFFLSPSCPRHVSTTVEISWEPFNPPFDHTQSVSVLPDDFLFMLAHARSLKRIHASAAYDAADPLIEGIPFEDFLGTEWPRLLDRFFPADSARQRTRNKSSFQHVADDDPHHVKNLLRNIPGWAEKLFAHEATRDKILDISPVWRRSLLCMLTVNHLGEPGVLFHLCNQLSSRYGLEADVLAKDSSLLQSMHEVFAQPLAPMPAFLQQIVDDRLLVVYDRDVDKDAAAKQVRWLGESRSMQRYAFFHLYIRKVCYSEAPRDEKIATLKRFFLNAPIQRLVSHAFWMLPRDGWREELWADRDFLRTFFAAGANVRCLPYMGSEIYSDYEYLKTAIDAVWDVTGVNAAVSLQFLEHVEEPGLVLRHTDLCERLLYHSATCEWTFKNLEAPKELAEMGLCNVVVRVSQHLIEEQPASKFSNYFGLSRGKLVLRCVGRASRADYEAEFAAVDAQLKTHVGGIPLPSSAVLLLKEYNRASFGDHEDDQALLSAIDLVPDARENPALVVDVLRSDKINIDVRRSLFRNSVPLKMQENVQVMSTAVRLFGEGIYRSLNIEDFLHAMPDLLLKVHALDHDGKSTNGWRTARSDNSAYLRSLYLDMRDALTPSGLKEATEKLFKVAPTHGASYVPTFEDWQGLFGMDSDKIASVEAEGRLDRPRWFFGQAGECSKAERVRTLLKLKKDVECISDAVASILEPRKREGASSYPSSQYVEAFDGVRVEFRFLPTDAEKAGKKRKKRMNDAFDLAEAQPEGSRRVLVTTSGKVVNIPQAWQEELDDHVENKNLGSFWGVLFAGDGQRSKSMRLKNGKWDSLDDWNGVRIKVYDIDADFTLPGSPFPSFIDQVPRFNTFNEAEMLKRHRESRARGGGGVTFLSYPSNTTVGQAGRLVPYDAAGYTTYAQKIVDFLEVVPLHCLQLLENELEMSGIDIFDEDLDDSLLPDFETVVQTVKTSLLPPEVEKPKKAKRPRLAEAADEEELPTVQSATPATSVSEAGPSGRGKRPASYWSSDDDDDDDDDVNWDEVVSSDEE